MNAGERGVLEFFHRHLARDWEIYVQPHLNGLRPDLVLLNPRVGVAVFEVKDWDFDAVHYSLDPKKRPPALHGTRADGACFRQQNPVEQLYLYKTEIARLYCPGLDRIGGIAAVTAGLIFPRAEQAKVEEAFTPALTYRASTVAAKRYWRLVGREALARGDIDTVLPDCARHSSALMTEEVADDLRHWLIEPDFAAEQRRRPFLDRQQRALVETRTSDGYRRVRGPAGSGKTLALAGRAATLEREGKDVLVVTYNITLLNYLRDGVVRFGADPRRITWLNFHAWCKRTLIQLEREDDYRALFRGRDQDDELGDILDEALPALVLEAVEDAGSGAVPVYDAVLVDEGQDMLPSWWAALRKVAKPKPEGEMMLLADRGQDVYLRNSAWTEEAMLGAGFSGPWSTLKTSYRTPRQLTELARTFLGRYLPDPDMPLPEAPEQQELEVDTCRLTWVQTTPEALAASAVEALRRMVVDSRAGGATELAFADIVFLCDRLELGRDVMRLLGDRNIRVADTFALCDRTRRRQKQHFYKGSDRVKGTTLHSFKRWEGGALVVAAGDGKRVSDRRALYAGLTRLKAHPRGSHLTVVSSDSGLRPFGELWPRFEDATFSS